MAKAKKAKNEDQQQQQQQQQQQKGDNSEAVVRHQKLCLSIDMDKRHIYGYTELEMVVPDNGIVGLHADNLVIESVKVDGEPAEFEVFPHYLHLDNGDRWCSVSTSVSAADAAGSVYLSSLERELVPNLLIMCSKSTKAESEQQSQVQPENREQWKAERKQNVKVIRIDYWVEKAETGIHFDDNVLHTDNQIRRARCWFPCMDDNLQRCCYDMEFTVAGNFVAVSTGSLLYQVLSKDDPNYKTYVYKLNVPVTARWISLAVAPFEILPDRNSSLLSHMCLPGQLSKLHNTVGFFHGAFSHYEDYLFAKFPFGSYTQVFIAPEMAISSLNVGASVSIFSSHVLFDEKVIDQTIETRIKLAYALARQWFGVFITPEAPSDEWLLDGLAGFLTDSFIKKSLGNNEARYRRYKANCAVCRADDCGATALSSSASCKDLYGTQCIGFYGKIRSWKSVAILQMLEKQMGPESFRKILQLIVFRAQDATRSLRSLSTKEFRHLANKVGNLERPFLKEFFPRWVGSCGCPVLKMGFSYNKRKNMIELAVLRGCTARPDANANVLTRNTESESREGDDGWPGMMSIRVHELDGMYDHPILPMAGEPWQLLEIQCHSKLATKRFQKPKKGSKPDGSDDNGDAIPTLEMRSNSDSPLLWLRADPEMEYLAESHVIQPVQMWINQLEKDKDVVAQAQAIATLEGLPQLSFAVVNALNNFLSDTKAFWRVRIEAAFALAVAASEETDWAGLFHLIKFYKSRRFDLNIGLPKANDFHDFQEYFVLEAIPHAVATVRATDRKSPREAVEFVLQLLKYNDNNGNPYSDVFWLAALVQSIGELEFGQQSIVYLSSLLKRIDRLLQFDRLMPSHNGILTVSCIRSLTQIAVKLSEFIPLDRVVELIKPFRVARTSWQIRVEACRALLDLEFQHKGLDAALILFLAYLNEETSIRGQVKLGVHAMRLCQMREASDSDNDVKSETLVSLLRLLESPMSFNNVILRHYIFCILQVLAGRAPTLYGVPRDETLRMGHAETCSELKNIFAALVKQSKPLEPPLAGSEFPQDTSIIPEAPGGTDVIPASDEHAETDVHFLPEMSTVPEVQVEEKNHEQNAAMAGESHDHLILPEAPAGVNTTRENEQVKPQISISQDNSTIIAEASRDVDRLGMPGAPREVFAADKSEQIKPRTNLSQDNTVVVEASKELNVPSTSHDQSKPVADILHETATREASREPDTVSTSQERRKPVFRIKVKQSAASSRAEDPDYATLNKSQDGHHDADRGASSSVSVDAPLRNLVDSVSISNQNLEDVESCHDVGSRVTASIGSAKVAADADELGKELQCTADSSKVSSLALSYDHTISSSIKNNDAGTEAQRFASLQNSTSGHDVNSASFGVDNRQHEVKDKKDKKKDKEKKRKHDERKAKHDDPEYLERKRLKKEKKRKEKELAKLLEEKPKAPPPVELQDRNDKPESKVALVSREARVPLDEAQNRGSDTETMSAMGDAEQKASSLDMYQKDAQGTKISSVQLVPGETSRAKVVEKKVDTVNAPRGNTSHKLKIKIKGRTLQKS